MASDGGGKGIGWGDYLEEREGGKEGGKVGREHPPLGSWRGEVAGRFQLIKYCT